MTRTTQDIDALHRAVNQMRTMRRNLETLKAWAGGEAGGKTLVAGAADFDKHMAPIEEQLIQVNMKASETISVIRTASTSNTTLHCDRRRG